MKKSRQEKILIILGPTASGKSALAVELAKKFNGEVISADSRQVYRGLDIGSGKITKKEMRGVPHHLLDIENPKNSYTAAGWQKDAKEKIEEIISRGKLPIICGGTGFYIESITKNTVFPEVPPNKELRKNLEKKNTEELVRILKKLDSARLKNIDTNNPVRLIRAIEIAKKLGSVPNLKTQKPKYEILNIGLKPEDATLKNKLMQRLNERMKKGMVAEAKKLHTKGLSFKRMNELGLEYRYLALYLQKKISKSGMVEKLGTEIWQFSRRQMTWFRRDKEINWFENGDTIKIVKLVNNFLTR